MHDVRSSRTRPVTMRFSQRACSEEQGQVHVYSWWCMIIRGRASLHLSVFGVICALTSRDPAADQGQGRRRRPDLASRGSSVAKRVVAPLRERMSSPASTPAYGQKVHPRRDFVPRQRRRQSRVVEPGSAGGGLRGQRACSSRAGGERAPVLLLPEPVPCRPTAPREQRGGGSDERSSQHRRKNTGGGSRTATASGGYSPAPENSGGISMCTRLLTGARVPRVGVAH